MNTINVWILAVLVSANTVAIAYQVPTSSNSFMQYSASNGTMTIDVLFNNWTGFWIYSRVINAGMYFADDNNGLWSSNDNLVLSISPVNVSGVDRRVLHLSRPINRVNLYESEAFIDDVADCKENSACCETTDGQAKQFDLHQNDTQYVVYDVTVGQDVRQFELSLKATVTDPGSQNAKSEEALSIQPWQSLDGADATQASSTTASATSTNLDGNVIMANIGVESYDIFDAEALGQHYYVLAQSSLDDEGTLVDYYFAEYEDWVGKWGMAYMEWADWRPSNCDDPLGGATSPTSTYNGLANTPYNGAWTEGSADFYLPYAFSEPLPDPSPIDRAQDPYNQLAWYENNVWAFSPASAPAIPSGGDPVTPIPRFPSNQQQYARNTIAANIRADLANNCSMLFNAPSAVNVSVGDGGEEIAVNLEQAVICEYPNNTLAITFKVSMLSENAFGFAKGQLGGLEGAGGSSVQILEKGSFLETDFKWYPGAKSGWVNVTLINTSDMPQLVKFTSGACCMMSPSLKCDYVDATTAVNNHFSGVSVGSADLVSLRRHESAFASLRVYVTEYGEGYCNASFSHVYFDGKAVATNLTSPVSAQLTFSASLGPPVTFTVAFNIYFLNMERNQYLLPQTGDHIGNPGVAQPDYVDEVNGIKARVGDYLQGAANAEAPGSSIILGFLPENQPIFNFTSRRRLLAAKDPAGMYFIITWPPAQSNATALRFNSSLPTIAASMPSSVLGSYGPASCPAGSVTITSTYAPPPPAQSPPPPPPPLDQSSSSSILSPLPTAGSNQSLPANQVTDCGGQSIDCGAHGDLTAACECHCQVGWTTQPFQSNGVVHYCMMPTDVGTPRQTSLLFGGSNKVGPLGVVVIVVVVVCLVSSAWLCLMMHRRTQASTSMAAQRSIVMFEHEEPREVYRAPKLAPGLQLQSQSSTSALLASSNMDRDNMVQQCSRWRGEASLPQFQKRPKSGRA